MEKDKTLEISQLSAQDLDQLRSDLVGSHAESNETSDKVIIKANSASKPKISKDKPLFKRILYHRYLWVALVLLHNATLGAIIAKNLESGNIQQFASDQFVKTPERIVWMLDSSVGQRVVNYGISKGYIDSNFSVDNLRDAVEGFEDGRYEDIY